ncbi:hypothetical protein PF438_14575 [Elizabethkingia meningoseptica]|uniref:hypothetical protein n=1 Tax=Elizabethkingia meningoseptica TaxID=238 RepID=UPI0022F1A48C|nr:hypothetical protein [Elizabethkingia meningoseptica]EJK5328120.1 hypothetical protein [Elizabethkingia meningoseptica]MCT3897520.1 hypothetical protein [Elizabethkingia anophelis]WBS74116.1 hypothetical protein PF438_14575 [Elizabethkingia meningoseptica]
MKSVTSIFISSVCLLLGLRTYAQAEQAKIEKKKVDSIKLFYLTEAAVRNPILRQVVVSTEVTGNSNIESDLYGNRIFDGKINQSKTTALVTLPITSWSNNSITGSLLFEHHEYRLSDISISNSTYQSNFRDSKFNRNTLGFSAGYQRIDSLFGRNVVYAANINGVSGKPGSIQRFSFLGTVILNLKQTKTTNFSAGLVLNVDQSINFPVFPIVTYWHKFKNDMELNINLPQQAYLRKNFSSKLSGSLGTTISISNSFFEYSNQEIVPKNFNYTTLSLQSGVGIEYRLAKKILIGLNGGVQSPLSARAFEVGENSKNYFINNKIGSTPYVKLSVSLLPIFKSVF